MDIFTTAGYL
uniref:Uncharacterized protein n=1 Tax=Anguilla anguilla TaxID=7936 RepID=A0A0E9XT60_ANGAN